MDIQAELILKTKNTLGEGPVWDERTESLYWIDILEHRLLSLNTTTGETGAYDVGQPIGSFALTENGTFVCALRDGFHELDPSNGSLTLIADPESDKPGNRFNDGKCDPQGRFWAGTMEKNDGPGEGALYVLRTDRTAAKALNDIGTSNGICWTSDSKTMYYIDSLAREVWSFDFDADGGELSNKKVVVRIPEGGGFPDGMTIDREGMLWVAQWEGWQVSRWDPATGTQIGTIELPVAKVTSCIFGGPNWDELYITTARVGYDDEQIEAFQPHAGSVFRAKPGVQGWPSVRYRG